MLDIHFQKKFIAHRKILRIVGVLASLTAAISGCAVREQAFDCINQSDSAVSDELVMTPTTARFQSTHYSFLEERGAVRTYRQKETGQVLEFNPASGLLIIRKSRWLCKKYSLDVTPSSRN